MGMINNLKVHPAWIPPRAPGVNDERYEERVAELRDGTAQFSHCGTYATGDDYSINEDGKLLIHTTSWHDFVIEMDKDERECLENSIIINGQVWLAKFSGELDPDMSFVYIFEAGIAKRVIARFSPGYSWSPQN